MANVSNNHGNKWTGQIFTDLTFDFINSREHTQDLYVCIFLLSDNNDNYRLSRTLCQAHTLHISFLI